MRVPDPNLAAKRRRQIIEAAMECFREKGFHGAAMSAICRKSGMSPGAVYHYFSSKEDLIEAIVEADSRLVEERFARYLQSDSPVDAMLSKLGDIWSDSWGVHGALNGEIMAEAARNPRIREIVRARDARVRSLLASLVEKAKDRDQVDAAVDPDSFGRLLIALAQGIALADEIDPELDRQRAAEALRQLIVRALQLTPRS